MIEVIKLEDDDGVQDADFLSLLEAAEADALASAGKIKRQKISSSAVSERETAEIEGSYAAALRGSRSSLWQQQQELLHPQRKSKENSSSFTVTGGGSGDACFKCGLSGHWARDCTVASGVGGGVGGGGGGRGGEGSGHGGSMVDDAVAEKPCPCGSGICLVLTSNTAKNPGRKFYRCPVKEENGGCNFFEWCDNPSSGVPTSGRASTEGRGSYSVSKWSSESSSMSRQTSFPSQAQSTYNNSYSSSRSSGERNSSSCFKCGQEGHWARDCTKSSSTKSYANMGGSHLASSGSGSCFKCGKTGHWARDCTAQDFSAGAGSGDRKASRSFRTPFPNKY